MQFETLKDHSADNETNNEVKKIKIKASTKLFGKDIKIYGGITFDIIYET